MESPDTMENLEQSITALQKALEEHTLERSPVDYAVAQTSLGEAYRRLAEYKEEPWRCLRKSIVAYKEALKVYTLNQFRVEYARTMGSLAVSYGELAWVGTRMDPCLLARKCIHEALDILTEKEFPQEHQKFQKVLERIEEIYDRVRWELM